LIQIQAYSSADVGSDSSSLVTRQGPDGILYFGGDSLLSFDGAKWRQSSVNGGYAIRGLDFGKNGKLWAAANGELGWYDQDPSGSWNFHSLLSKLSAQQSKNNEGWSVFAESSGALFVTDKQILRWDGEKFQVWPMPTPRHLEGMRSGDDIYVHHWPTGLYLIAPEGPRLIIPHSVLGKAMILWLEPKPHGYLLATSEGMFNFSEGKLAPFAPEASDYVRQNRLTCATKLSDGRIALGTYLGGIAIISETGSLDQILREKDGLPTDSILSLFVDREQGLWATSDFNIFRVTLNSSSQVFDDASGLQSQPIIRITRSQGRINVATPNGISEMDSSTDIFRPINTPVMNVTDLQATDQGLLVASASGIKRINQGKATGILSVAVNAYAVKSSRRSPGKFLVSEGNSILLVDENGKGPVIVKDLPDIVTSVAEDTSGRLWMGTNNHAVLVANPGENGPVEATPTDASVGLAGISGSARVVPGANGSVLVVFPTGGRFLGEKSSRFVDVEKFPPWPVNAVSDATAEDSFWVAHPAIGNRSASVARIVVEGSRAIWQPHSVDGLWNIGIPESIFAERNPSGETTLWIGGTKGLLKNNVGWGPVAPAPSAPLLRGMVRTDHSEVMQGLAPSLPYSTRGIVFEFASPEFARRPALHLETKLDGVDQQWVPADASSRREFTALREGSYTFQVRTVAETGVASQAAIATFEILPPWWRTGTAILGALLALVPTGYGLYRWRVRRLHLRNAELEHKVLERTDQLEKASAAKTQFVANMSHDIRNPLNGIVGLALALEDTWLDVKQRELVSTLRECTTYLSTLVDDVLDFASIEAGKVELRPSPFAPAELLRSIAMMFKMEAIASGAVLQVETDPELPTAYVGDAGRIQQILVNFVTNALKYAGGPVKLSATIPTDAPEEIEFSVTDQGPGISEEGQRALFAKFSRLTGSQSKEITGTGLGLASCRLLAGLMCGSVGVRSSEGQGARFYLRLPLDIFPVPAPDAPAKPMATPILPNCNVLLVEDTNYNAMAAAAVLGKFGLSCERVSTGAEALKLFAEKRHNLVLLDRNLPDMDGTEVARRIRALESNGPRTIILAVTAYCTLEDRALCLNAGMDAFVGKPLTPQKLRRVLTAAGRRHLAAASMHISPEIAATGAVDVSLLEYISDGTGQGLSRQIELFLTALGDAEKQLDQAARHDDFKLLGEAAHGVLSHARLVGSASLATAASALQNAANNRDREAFGSLLSRVRRETEALTAVVRRHPGAEKPA
jgi:signal transduction histidine kinase/DNA-binding response OmpR family regulator